MKPTLQLFVVMTLWTIASASHAQSICVYDPSGAGGDGYSFIKDYALVAKQWGADLTLKPYIDDAKANSDFKDGKCDALTTMGLRAREFNNFTGSIDAVGAVPDMATAKTIIYLMGNPKLAGDMVSGDSEVAGVAMIGPGYPMVNDRAINSMAKMNGRRFGVLEFDKPQTIIADKMGCNIVPVSIATVGNKFNSGQVEVVSMPAMAFKALDLAKGMGSKGAIGRIQVVLLTNQILIHPTKFPDGYGQKSRTWIAGQLARQVKSVEKIETSIDGRYWVDVPASDKLGYNKLFRQVRIGMAKEGLYNKRMMGILKKVRCVQDPGSYECPLTEE